MACAATLAVEPDPTVRIPLRLFSFNIEGGGSSTARSTGKLLELHGADLVSLQEVPNASYLGEAARAGGYSYVSRLDRGKAILSRTPLDLDEVIELVVERSLIHVTTVVHGIKLSIYGVHLAWDVDGNLQAKQIVESVLPRDSNSRKILLGDFNDEHFSTQNATLELTLTDAFSDLGIRPGERTSWPATGFAGVKGHQLIDLLLYDPRGGMRTLWGDILHLNPVLSDHRPVVFDLELSDPVDVVPPSRIHLDTPFDLRTLIVRFDREIDDRLARETARYTIQAASGEPGPDVEEATVERDLRSVRLRTGLHQPGLQYEISVGGMPARAGARPGGPLKARYLPLINLLANPGAEDGTSGWQVTRSMASLTELRLVRPHSGGRMFAGAVSGSSSTAAQTVNLDDFAKEIDDQRATALVGAYLGTAAPTFLGKVSQPMPYDDAEVIAEALAASGAVLAKASSGKVDSLYWRHWRSELPLPPGARSLRVMILAHRKMLNPGQNNAVVDDVTASVRIDLQQHFVRGPNLLQNGDLEASALGGWEATPGVVRLANYAQISGSQVVAASGEALVLARTSRSGSRLAQTVALSAHGPLDYLRWGGEARTWGSRMRVTLRLLFLDFGDRVLLEDSRGPFHEAEWRHREWLTPIPIRAEKLRFSFEAEGSDEGSFGDNFFAQVVGGDSPQGWFARGDVERDGRLLLTDAVLIFRRIFSGAQEPCDSASDVNDDGRLEISDGISLLNFLFTGASPPRPPSVDSPGPDPTPDSLGC